MSPAARPEPAVGILPAPLAAWCADVLRQAGAGDDSRLTGAARVPSRTSEVYRIAVGDGSNGPRSLYLKHFVTEPSDVLATRFVELARIAAALARHPALTPYVIVAADAGRRLLLTQEMPGQTLLALHRGVKPLFGNGVDRIAEAWRGVGTWLAALHHSAAATASTTRVSEIATFAADQLRVWAAADGAQAALADTALDAVARVAARCAGSNLQLTPCHGDVSGSNIFVSSTVGLIDFDDVRTDCPALDVSQAVLELQNLCHAWSTVPLTQVMDQAGAAFADGYGADRPDGPSFWLLHLRNLSVFLLTLARRRHGVSVSRVTNELHYGRTVSELKRTVNVVLDSDGTGSFWAGWPSAERGRGSEDG